MIARTSLLASSLGGRAIALFVGLSGPASALLVLSALEREPSPLAAYLLVPLLGALGPLAASRVARRLSARNVLGSP